MGIGMLVTFRGFARSFAIEAEASVRLVRLERFGRRVADCNLTITALQFVNGTYGYEAQLDLIARDGLRLPGQPFADTNPERAVMAAFHAAELLLGGNPSALRR
jgi:hypothetical protein